MMVSILSHKLCVAVLIAAFALPLAFVVWRAIAGTGSWWRKILRGLGHLVVILLAQASMARVVDTLKPEDKRVPILASPNTAVDYLATILK